MCVDEENLQIKDDVDVILEKLSNNYSSTIHTYKYYSDCGVYISHYILHL